MAGPENPETPKADVETVLAEFDGRENMLAAFCARTKGLIEASLQDANIRYQSVQARVKTKKKLREKYLDPAKNYKRLDDITDLAGLRIITYYEDEVDHVAQVIRREFDIDLVNSVDKRDTEPDRFRYSAINYVCRHLAKRGSDVEYKKFASICCEIQVTSILRHAWSEIEHEWYDLKEAYPDSVKRRFSRTLALLEVADSEFLDIRKQRADYQKSVAVRVEARVPDLPIDAVSLRPFIEREPVVGEVDALVAAAMGREMGPELSDSTVERRSTIANCAGIHTLQDLRSALMKYRMVLPEFVRRCRADLWPASAIVAAERGICIHHLGLFLTSIQGKREVVAALKALGVKNILLDIDGQVSIAQEVFIKYTS
jgi:putative GTP pyrophosphokinase